MTTGALFFSAVVVGRLHDVGRQAERDRDERERILRALHAQEREQARLEGVALAVREAAHRLNNALTQSVGNLDLIAEDPALPPDLRRRVEEALAGLDRAGEEIRKFQGVVRVKIKHEPIGPTLDLERSSAWASSQASPRVRPAMAESNRSTERAIPGSVLADAAGRGPAGAAGPGPDPAGET